MPDQQINFLIKAQNTASPEFRAATAEVRNLGGAVKAYGTATPEAKRATAGLLSELRGMKGATDGGKIGLEGLGTAAKGVAAGGFQNLLSAIPGVGGALANLAGQLGAFPLLLGGIVGVGAGVITFLQGLSAESTKALAAITALSAGITRDFQKTNNEIAKLAATAAQDRGAAIRATYKAATDEAEAAKQDRLTKAKEELDAVSGIYAELTGKRAQAEQKFRVEQAAAESEAMNRQRTAAAEQTAALIDQSRQRLEIVKGLYDAQRAAESDALQATLTAEGKKTAALEVGINQRKGLAIQAYDAAVEQIEREFSSAEEKYRLRESAFATLQAKLTQLETEGGEQRRAIIEQTTQAALAVYEKLGRGFEDITRKLSVATFVQEAQRGIEALRALGNELAAGDAVLKASGLTAADVASGIQKLTEDMATAVTKGFIPVREAATAATPAIAASGAAAVAAGAGFQQMAADAMTGARALAVLDAARARGGATGGGSAVRPGMSDAATAAAVGRSLYDQTQLDSFSSTLQSAQDTLRSYDSARSLSGRGYATGGVIPGAGPTPILAHGGEIIGPPKTIVAALTSALRDVSGPRTTVNFHDGAIRQSGTVISQERDWATLVETLADSLAARRN